MLTSNTTILPSQNESHITWIERDFANIKVQVSPDHFYCTAALYLSNLQLPLCKHTQAVAYSNISAFYPLQDHTLLHFCLSALWNFNSPIARLFKSTFFSEYGLQCCVIRCLWNVGQLTARYCLVKRAHALMRCIYMGVLQPILSCWRGIYCTMCNKVRDGGKKKSERAIKDRRELF